MIKHRTWIAIAVTSLFVVAHSEIQTTVVDAGTIVTSKGYNIATKDLNEGSSLRRSWVTFNDTNCPITITEPAFSVKGRSGDFSFRAEGSMKALVPVSAFEIHILLFDVFGSPMKNLSATVIKDYGADDDIPLSGTWDIGWTHAERLLTAVVYVANVRTQAGAIWQYSEVEVPKTVLQLDLMAMGADKEPKGSLE